MIPIFSTLNMMQRALEVQQEAIQTTGNNISNANTDGYSRQRVNMTASTPYPSIGMNAAGGAGQIGTGVDADSIQRIRDSFLDLQVRYNENQNGYWSTVDSQYSQMEDIVAPTDNDLSSVLDTFWSSLQDMASNSGTSGTGAVVLQDGQEVADTFNYIATSLNQVQSNTNQQITEVTNQVNNLADQINSLNKEITTLEANGYVTNDLYDTRDNLVDQLSQLVNVKVSTVPSGGNPSALAVGKYTIELTDENGNSLGTLVDGTNLSANHLSTTIDNTTDPDSPSVKIDLADGDGNSITTLTDTTDTSSSATSLYGKLQGLVDTYTNDFPSVLKSLDNLANTLTTNFNAAYAGSAGSQSSGITEFFTSASSDGKVTAATIQVNSALKSGDITANSATDGSGGNSSATAMANVIASDKYDVDGNVTDTGSGETLKNYLADLIGQIGVNAQSADQFSTSTQTMLTTSQNNRSSVSGVSMDEEMVNLIQYQHAYSSAAKVVTTLNEMLDTLINIAG